MATHNEVINVLAVLITAFSNPPISEQTIKLYVKMLEHLNANVLESAVLKCVAKNTFFPRIAEILTAASEITLPELPAAGEAWGEAVDMMRFRGHSWEPKFDNPVTQRCVEALGWYYLCMSESQVADRARFIELYTELARRHMTEERTHPLVKQLVAKMSPAMLKNSYYEQLPRGEKAETYDDDEIKSAFDRGAGE